MTQCRALPENESSSSKKSNLLGKSPVTDYGGSKLENFSGHMFIGLIVELRGGRWALPGQLLRGAKCSHFLFVFIDRLL
jgi:hypothetical protein